MHYHVPSLGFPGGSDSKESACHVEYWVQSLDWEDLLEKGMATHFSIIAWSISSNPYPLMALYFIIPTIIGEETQSHEVK